MSPLSIIFSFKLFVNVLYKFMKAPLYFYFVNSFHMNGCCIYSNAFPASMELIIFFSPLIYEHELLNWFSNTEKIIPCIPRIYTTCLWNINLLCIVEMLLISLYWPIVFFLCWPYWNFIPKLCSIHKISSRIFLIFKILCNCFWKARVAFSLDVL